jgi:hypothetical protein
MVSSNDGYVRGYRYVSNGFVKSHFKLSNEIIERKFNSEISCMNWDSVNKILYCGQDNGNILLWHLRRDDK